MLSELSLFTMIIVTKREFMMRILLILIVLLISVSARAGATDWMPFDVNNGHIEFEVVVDGIPTKAIIDSGSQLNAISTRFMEAHDLEYDVINWIRVQGVHKTVRREIYDDVPLAFLGTEVPINLVAGDFGSKETGILLGAPLLRNFIVQFDYPNSKLRFATRDSMNLDEVANLRMRAQKNSGIPLVQVTLGEEEGIWMLLDTGNSGGIIVERRVAAHEGWLENYAVEKRLSRGVNGIGFVETFSLPTAKFGPFELENVQVVVPGDGESFNSIDRYKSTFSRIRGVRVEGIVGYDMLKHFVLTLDYRAGQGHIYAP